ncbi:CHAT domain-containing protein [Spirulina major]|uniref:CHAT domain-containing protein n=1 Tax=Spirulina major TaxID=270636 RepID=UPI001C31314B|nr:CHAT domain-containing protein [Spirulina major]
MGIIRWLLLGIFTLLLVIGGRSLPAQSQPSDPLSTVIHLQNQAIEQQENGNIREAIATIQNSLTFLNPPTTTHQEQALANSLNILGDLYFTQSHFQAALEVWERIQPLYDQTPEWAAYRHRNLIKQNQAQQHLGRITQSCQLLLSSLNQSDPLICDAKGTIDDLQGLLTQFSSPSERETESLLELADLWRKVGQFTNAQNILEKLAQQQPHNPQIILTQANLARSQGDQERAQQESEDGIQFDPKFCPSPFQSKFYIEAWQDYQHLTNQSESEPGLKLRSQIYQVNLELLRGNISSAIELINTIPSEALNNPQKTDLNWPLTRLQYAQALHCVDVQSAHSPDIVNATQYTDQAIALVMHLAAIAQSQGNVQIESYAWGYLGRFQEQKGALQPALEATEQALSLSRDFPHLKYQWLWQKGRILKQQNHPRAQLLPIYRSAYKNLENLRNNLVAFNQEIQYDFRDRVEPLYREYVDLLLPPGETAPGKSINAPETPTQDELKQARDVIEALQLAELDNFFQDDCTQFANTDVGDVDEKAAFFFTILLRDRLAVIVDFKNQNLLYHSSPNLTQFTITKVVKEFRVALTQEDGRNPNLFLDTSIDYGFQIYDWLLKPFEAVIEQQRPKNLIFSLDDVLRGIPLSALQDQHKEYLLEKDYTISVVPSTRIFPPHRTQDIQKQVLSIGLSNFEYYNQKYETRWPNLKNVDKEIDGIHQLFSVTDLRNENFTTVTLQKMMISKIFPIVHIATHGTFSSNPNQTSLITYDSQLNLNELADIFQEATLYWKQDLEILVLSACQTAQGNNRAALGMAGIALRSGARSTVASLWNVNDLATAQLMIKFYEILKTEPEQGKAYALKIAQQYIRELGYLSPYYWSPFILLGNWL